VALVPCFLAHNNVVLVVIEEGHVSIAPFFLPFWPISTSATPPAINVDE
jgi:hypothetical protein